MLLGVVAMGDDDVVVAGEMRVTWVLQRQFKDLGPGGGHPLEFILNKVWKYRGWVVDNKTVMPDVLKAKGQSSRPKVRLPTPRSDRASDTRPGKMRVHLENLEISWIFKNFNKNHGKMI